MKMDYSVLCACRSSDWASSLACAIAFVRKLGLNTYVLACMHVYTSAWYMSCINHSNICMYIMLYYIYIYLHILS